MAVSGGLWWCVAACWLAGAQGQLNPLGRFGRCMPVPVHSGSCLPEGRVWYLQYRTDNPDHYVHTCQAQYEKTINDRNHYYNSLLYYYNKGQMVHNPQAIKYRKVSDAEYIRGITVDGEAVNVKMIVVHYDPVKEYRMVYYCTDSEKANPAIVNINVSTLDQEPCNLEEVLSDARARLQDCGLEALADVPLMRVEQSRQHCEPIKVSNAC